MSVEHKHLLSRVVLPTGVVLLGWLANHLGPHSPGFMPLFPGAIAFYFLALRYGLPWGLGAAALLALAARPELTALLFPVEALMAAELVRRRTWPVWRAALVFWAGLGLPLAALLGLRRSELGPEVLALNLLALGLFGGFNLTLAQLLARINQADTRDNELPLSRLLADRLALFGILPLALAGLWAAERELTQHEAAESSRLEVMAGSAAREVEARLGQHLGFLRQAAHLAVLPLDERAKPLLAATSQAGPGFLSLLTADAEGRVVALHTRAGSGLDGRPGLGLSVADRSYFQEPMRTGKDHVSAVFRGRAIGRDLLVALSAPVRDAQGRVAGVLEGSLELKAVGEAVMASLRREGGTPDFVVLDGARQVVFSSLSDYPALQTIPEPGPLSAGEVAGRQRRVSARIGDWGWRLVLLADRQPGALRFNAVAIAVTLAGLALLFAARRLAWRFALRLAAPLNELAERVRSVNLEQPETLPLTLELSGTREVASLSADIGRMVKRHASLHLERMFALADVNQLNARLEQANRELETMNRDLEGRVAERTAELDAARQRAEELALAKGQFLANMSHEIRTPLTAILGYTESLLKHEIPAQEGEAALEIVLRNGRYLLELINQLLDHAKIERGQLQLERLPYSPRAILEEAGALLRRLAAGKGLELRLSGLDRLPPAVYGDPTRFRQILLNLGGNAVKFTAQGQIAVDADYDAQAHWLSLRIQDTGIGMSEAALARLFQPFSQADVSTTRRFGGTGLGLAISRDLARAMGGDIAVSSNPGTGSCFTLVLRSKPAPAEALAAQEQSEETPRLAGRVLLAEDQKDNQALIGLLIRATGAEVEAVDDGSQAVARALEGGYDLVLMDMQMPVMDGAEALQRLRAGGYGRPIVALTANMSTTELEHYRTLGFDASEGKPVQRPSFYRTLKRFLKPAGDSAASAETRTEPSPPVPPAGFAGQLAKLSAQFAHQLPERVRALKDAIVARDAGQAGRLAHSLKGSAGSFGFPGLSRCAADLESALKSDSWAPAEAALETLERESAMPPGPPVARG